MRRSRIAAREREIDGELYWDGSYGANPMLRPLCDDEPGGDIFIAELTPQRRTETPATARNILNRINEIASINGLVSEIRMLARVDQERGSKATRLHVLSLRASYEDGEVAPSTKRTIDTSAFPIVEAPGVCRLQRLACGPIGIRSAIAQPWTSTSATCCRIGKAARSGCNRHRAC